MKYAYILILTGLVSHISAWAQTPKSTEEQTRKDAVIYCTGSDDYPASEGSTVLSKKEKECIDHYRADHSTVAAANNPQTTSSSATLTCTPSVNGNTLTCENGITYKKDVSGSTANALKKSAHLPAVSQTQSPSNANPDSASKATTGDQ